MSELHWPWLELSIVIPAAAALCVGRLRDSEAAHKASVIFAAATLACTTGAWIDFSLLDASQAHGRWDLAGRLFGANVLVVDQLSAPLLPLTALLYFVTVLTTLRTKIRQFSFAWTMASEAILLATLSCGRPWALVALLAAGTIPPYVELRARRKPTRVYALHMALFVTLLVLGWFLVESEGARPIHSLWATTPLLAAVLIRCGIAPLHCWMSDLFEHVNFGTALLFVTPMIGAYAAVRLVLPVAPDGVLHLLGLVSIATAVYAGGMALVQREARRFFCYLFLSHSALVLVGLETLSPLGVTGALCVWLSVGLALTGFGLTLRSVESRRGRISLASYHGLYEHTPTLASFFLLTGLASVGFPGTFGFVGSELLVEGAVQTYPYVGVAVVAAAALNGIAVVQAYFLIFAGKQHVSSISLRRRGRERWAVLTLAVLILGGGLYPQPGVASRHQAAVEIVRASRGPSPAMEAARRSFPFLAAETTANHGGERPPPPNRRSPVTK